MKEWSGLERVFRLSQGVEIGAHALALLAALEFKRLLQKDMMEGAVENEQGGQVINLSSAEWCALAGIFDRKAYDRARAKLEEHGIVGIRREGRVLRITLWPEIENKASISTGKDPEKGSEKQTESNNDNSSPRADHRNAKGIFNEVAIWTGYVTPISTIDVSDSKVENWTEYRIRNGTADRISRAKCNRTSDGTSHETPNGTSDRVPDRTSGGTGHGTAGGSSDGVTPSTVRSISSCQKVGEKRQKPTNHAVLGLICDNSFPFSQSQDITYRVNKYKLKRYSLYRYSLTRNSLLINTKINNSNNNEQRNNGLMFIHKLIHSSVDNTAEKREFGDKKTVDKKSPVIKAVDKKDMEKYAGFPNNQQETIGSKFRQLWQGEMGHELTAYQEEGILRFIRWGFPEEILIEALRCAVMADRKHMGYVLGVLRNWYNQGVRELTDISHVQQRWQDQRFLQRRVSQVV